MLGTSRVYIQNMLQTYIKMSLPSLGLPLAMFASCLKTPTRAPHLVDQVRVVASLVIPTPGTASLTCSYPLYRLSSPFEMIILRFHVWEKVMRKS